MSTKVGARNAAQDKARIREIRKLASGIHGLTVELEPDDDEAPKEKSESGEGKTLRIPNTTVGIKAITAKTATVSGYGIVFGEADLEGETFEPDTDYMLDLVPSKVVFYDHRLRQVKHSLGKTTAVTPDEYGIWVEAELDRNREYVDQVLEVIKRGKMGWSSGTAAHMVDKLDGQIKSWPIVEFSITPTPAEPRTLGVEVIKSLAAIEPAFGALLPEDARPASVQSAGEDSTGAAATIIWNQGENSMSNEQAQPTVDMTAVLAALQDQSNSIKALASKVEAFEQAPPVKKVTVAVVEDEADRSLKGNPFKTFGEFLQSVRRFQQGAMDQRLLPLRSTDPVDEAGFDIARAMGDQFVGSLPAVKAHKAAPTGLGEGLPQAGGYLVGTDAQTSILSRVYEGSQLLSRVSMDTISANSNGMTYWVEAETSRATGSRRGGVRFYWVAENSAITTSAPTFAEMQLRLKKAGAAVYVTEEMLADSTALESYVMRVMPEEIRFGVEDSIINGTGTGHPLGILNAPCLVTVSKEAGQAADTVVAANIIKMWARMWARSVSNAVWIVNQSIFPQLMLMSIPVGTGGALVYMPPSGLSGSPYGTLFGRPVLVHESAAGIGDVGDIILADMREYQAIEKGGIQSASSIHVRFLEGETCYRFIYRVDGQPAWRAALTPFKGTAATVSPFVTLEAR